MKDKLDAAIKDLKDTNQGLDSVKEKTGKFYTFWHFVKQKN